MFCEDFWLFRGLGFGRQRYYYYICTTILNNLIMGTTKSVTTHVWAKGACHFEAELNGNRLLSFIGICVKGGGALYLRDELWRYS